MSKRIKLKIASPCDADWEAMSGDEAKRFCGACKQDVYQLSDMSTAEVEALLKQRTGLRTCGRFYKRADGTVMTSDCSVGVSQKRKRRVLKVVGAAAFSMSAVGVGFALAPDAPNNQSPDIVEQEQPSVMGKISLELAEPVPDEPVLMLGQIAPQDPQMEMGDIEYVEPDPELVKGNIQATEISDSD